MAVEDVQVLGDLRPDGSSPPARTYVLSKVIGYTERMPRPGRADHDGTAVLSMLLATVEPFPNGVAPQVVFQYFESGHDTLTLVLESEDVARLMNALDQWKEEGTGQRREV
jgi:hypothetical protein